MLRRNALAMVGAFCLHVDDFVLLGCGAFARCFADFLGASQAGFRFLGVAVSMFRFFQSAVRGLVLFFIQPGVGLPRNNPRSWEGSSQLCPGCRSDAPNLPSCRDPNLWRVFFVFMVVPRHLCAGCS